MGVYNELKRRHVFRVAAAYLVVAWLVLQVADIVSPILALPEVIEKVVFFFLAIGFPIALILAWAFELKPEGVTSETRSDQSGSAHPTVGRKLNIIIIGVLAVAAALFVLDRFNSDESRGPAEPVAGTQETIAVLPFVNMSDDPEQEYFSDGLSEELLNLLAQIPELRVTSRTSAFSFKGKDVTIAEVGRTLNVEHILEGSVRRSGNRIRVTAQLIDASTDTHIWSDTWDRNFEDVFVIQDEIAEYVVDALKIELIGAIPHAFETTTEAYELYLQAKFLLEQPSAPNVRRAEVINQQLIDIDPEYVPAWNQRASIFMQGPGWNTWPMHESAPRAREAALESLRLFEKNGEAHAILGYVAFDFEYDYELAGRELSTALEMDPDNVDILKIAAEFEHRQGNFENAIELMEKGYAIDPITGRAITAALAYFYAGRQAEAIAIWEEDIRNNPNTPYLRKALALNLLEMGDVDGAISVIEQEPTEGHRLHAWALIYQTIGDSERSKEALENLIANSSRWTFEVTEVYSFRGELDEAFDWMDRAIERRDRGLRHVVYSPYLDNMRDDPRFDGVLTRIGLIPEH